ncbi:hypothetical protein GCM10007989_19170 [Devosia pacifica]|uniref:Uncharacterized protein n=1 Tax=Devosia pacifica TaxID=1335967 RepID=A0A918VTF8_9HYPH|nr:hypothetical protein GCM10007989_19170 [Devosia pacifica]
MPVAKVIGTLCHGRTQAPLDPVALWRVAGFLGHGEADTDIIITIGHCLQPKRRPPGAQAPGSSQKLPPRLQMAQATR